MVGRSSLALAGADGERTRAFGGKVIRMADRLDEHEEVSHVFADPNQLGPVADDFSGSPTATSPRLTHARGEVQVSRRILHKSRVSAQGHGIVGDTTLRAFISFFFPQKMKTSSTRGIFLENPSHKQLAFSPQIHC